MTFEANSIEIKNVGWKTTTTSNATGSCKAKAKTQWQQTGGIRDKH